MPTETLMPFARTRSPGPAGTATDVNLSSGGMTCASCVGRVERALRRVPGVTDVAVNLATERVHVVVADGSADAAALASVVEAAGYAAVPVREAAEIDEAVGQARQRHDVAG